MSGSDPREALLRALLCGERREDDEEVQRLLREDPALRAEWEEARRLQHTLDDLAGEPALLESMLAEPAPNEDRTLESFRQVLREHPRPESSGDHGSANGSGAWLRRLPALLAAAAVLTLAVWWFWTDDPSGPEPLEPDGPGRLVTASVVQEMEASVEDRELRWRIERPGLTVFVVLLDSSEAELYRSERLEASRGRHPWPEDLPAARLWRLEVYDGLHSLPGRTQALPSP